MRRIAPRVAALMLAAGAAGCASVRPFPAALDAVAPPAGSGDCAYSAGRATQTFGSAPDTVRQAALAGMDDLRITAVRQVNDAGAVILEGVTPDNRRATVTVRPHGGGARVAVRVGMFGDEPMSRAVIDRVGIRLGALPPSAVPIDPPSQPGSNPYFSREAVSNDEMLRDQADAHFRGGNLP